MYTIVLSLMLAQADRPAPQVQDPARFFTPETIKKANAAMADIKKRYKKDVFVESIKEIPADWKGKYDPEKKKAFFEKLVDARARAKKLDGVYILVCKRPNWTHFGADRVTEKKAFPAAMQKRLIAVVNEKFGKGEYDTGLLELLALIESAFAEVRERGSSKRPEGVSPDYERALTARRVLAGSSTVASSRDSRCRPAESTNRNSSRCSGPDSNWSNCRWDSRDTNSHSRHSCRTRACSHRRETHTPAGDTLVAGNSRVAGNRMYCSWATSSHSACLLGSRIDRSRMATRNAGFSNRYPCPVTRTRAAGPFPKHPAAGA
jgi:hypothetical protein